MPSHTQILRLVVASPSDVMAERSAVSSVADELNKSVFVAYGLRLEVVRWEIDAYPGLHPDGAQGLIDPIIRIEDCDILVGIFWKRFGTPTKGDSSGTAHEFRLAYEAWLNKRRPQVMVYFKEKPYYPKSKEEIDQWGQVLEFQRQFPKQGLWWPYKGLRHFKDLLRQHLIRVIDAQFPLSGRSQATTGSPPFADSQSPSGRSQPHPEDVGQSPQPIIHAPTGVSKESQPDASAADERQSSAEQTQREEENKQAAEPARLEHQERERLAAAEKARQEQEEREGREQERGGAPSAEPRTLWPTVMKIALAVLALAVLVVFLTLQAWTAARLTNVVVFVVCSVAIAKAFEFLEGALSPDGKIAISRWLKNLPLDSKVGSWSAAFSHLIDHLFGTNPRSLSFFLRSCVASLLAVGIVVFVYVRAHPLPTEDLVDSLVVLGLFCIPNLFLDYLSLLISRAVVKKMASHPATGLALRLLVLDALLKIIIASCIIFACNAAIRLFVLNSSDPFRGAAGTLREFYSGFPFPFQSGGGQAYGIFFYASFFTSIWVWFYVLGGILIKILTRTGKLWRRVVPFLDLDANPLKAIGRVVCVTLVAFYVIASVVCALARI